MTKYTIQLTDDQHNFLTFLIREQWNWVMGSEYSVLQIQGIIDRKYYGKEERWMLNSLRVDYKNRFKRKQL